jgi:PRTRC genetic system protein E
MNLFTTMAALVARGVRLTITVAQADGGNIEVGILPTSETGTTAVALVPKSFVASPADFDAEFPAILAGFCQANSSLKDQLAAVQVLTEQAGREASEKAVQTPAATKRKPGTVATSVGSAGKVKAEPELLGGGASDQDEDDDEPGDQAGTDAAPAGTAPAQPAQLLELDL